MVAYSKYTDQELVALLKNGSREAFNEIHDRYFEDLFRSAYNILRDRDTCMDIVQEVLIWFWEHRAQHQMASIKGYLLMATKYQTANYIRSSKVRENFRLKQVEEHYSFNEESLELQELKSIIESFTAQLPERCREVFKLSREQHLSNKEIAEKLGISEKTVSVQILRALNKLRADLGKMYFWINFFI
ncbi:RNA polymerase sigma-70 factor [Pedobacter nyackensis]|uniref:RNA polymerase sigma-70 factor n=1 Tax=Pedobacter nyackensis TaxID=475255 RepID=UPI00292CF1B1|nr:RNA polymerase sigma-70 factor [Pedobacter nyackensis]